MGFIQRIIDSIRERHNMREQELIKEFQVKATQDGLRLFRNNVGTGWIGDVLNTPRGLLIKNPRPLRAGLCEGSSDLIGWAEVEITQEMVGRKIAVFVGCEIKTGRLKATEKQQNFIDTIRRSGGIGIVARSYKDLKEALWPDGTKILK